MPLAANLFVQSDATRFTSRRSAAPASSTADSSPSFDDALEAARQPQQSSPPDRSATAVSDRDSAAARSEKKPKSDNDSTADSTDASDTTDDSQDSAQTSTQASTKTGDPSPADSNPAGQSKSSKDADPKKQPADPTDAAAQSVAAAQVLTNQPVPLPNAVLPPSNETGLADQAVAVADASGGVPNSVVKTQTTPPSDAPKKAPVPESSAGAPQLPLAATQTSGDPKPALKANPKTNGKGAQDTAADPQAGPTKATAISAKVDVDASNSQPDATAPVQQNVSPFAARSAAKTSSASRQTTDSSDSSQATSPGSVTTSASSATDDAVLTSTTVKALVNATTPQESPEPQSSNSTTPPTTATVNTPHPIDNRANSAAPAQDSPHADPDQTFEQIVLGLRTKVDATHSKAEISLNPPNLGTLHVSVSLQNGSLTAQFQSSSDAVRDLLKGNMEKLKSVLESQGVTVDKLAVGAPQDKTELPTASPGTAQTNQSANDGRSAGQYNQEPQNRKRSQDPSSFAKAWQQANNKAPIDLVA